MTRPGSGGCIIDHVVNIDHVGGLRAAGKKLGETNSTMSRANERNDRSRLLDFPCLAYLTTVCIFAFGV